MPRPMLSVRGLIMILLMLITIIMWSVVMNVSLNAHPDNGGVVDFGFQFYS